MTGSRVLLAGLLLANMCGCVTRSARQELNAVRAGAYHEIEASQTPRELEKVIFPTYRVEPPDVLLIEAQPGVRPADKPLQPGEELLVQVENGVPLEIDETVPPVQAQAELPLQLQFRVINGTYVIGAEGDVDLGPVYGLVHVAGLTTRQAREAIERHLLAPESEGGVGLRDPSVAVQLTAIAAEQPIAGEHIVRPDGTVSLGTYGSLPVVGKTCDEISDDIRNMLLARGQQNPKVNVDVTAYNSKVIYVVQDGGGFGETVTRLAWTGNETVLDAISQVNGLSSVSSKKIWVARPAPAGTGCAQTLDVHWNEIVAGGITTTNYQLAPGDRVYVDADCQLAFANRMDKLLNPVERVFGFLLLGSSTIRNVSGQNNNNGFNNGF